MAHAWLSLGANIGDPPAQLREAVTRISSADDIELLAASSVIITKPWGKTDQPDFANMAVAITTTLPPLALLDTLLGIEQTMGRVRKEVWGPRLIDIDIIAIDRLELRAPRLTVPHPHAHERAFVLEPLAELDAGMAEWVVEVAARR